MHWAILCFSQDCLPVQPSFVLPQFQGAAVTGVTSTHGLRSLITQYFQSSVFYFFPQTNQLIIFWRLLLWNLVCLHRGVVHNSEKEPEDKDCCGKNFKINSAKKIDRQTHV